MLAGGAGTRMGADRNKVLLEVGGTAVVVRSLVALDACPTIDHLVLVARDEDRDAIDAALSKHTVSKLRAVVAGGATRTGSEQAGLAVVRRMHADGTVGDEAVVYLHDAARPFVDTGLVDRLGAAAITHHASIPGVRFTEPVLRSNGGDGWCVVDAARLRRVQTPQAARCSVILAAYAAAAADHYEGLDTADVISRFVDGARVAVVEGAEDNIKLTNPDDLARAAAIVRSKADTAEPEPPG